MIIKNNKHIEEGSKEIWNFVLILLEKAMEKGFLLK
jgi:putative hydrolase of HD superfamily